MKPRREVANISHDLRTPLTSVIGYIQLLEDEDLSEEEREKYKEILLSRAKSLEGLIEGFYDLSRLESGDYRLELESVNLQNTLCEILASFYNDFESRGIKPQIDIDEKAPPIIVDANAVRRIFTNLIQNVLKHDGKNFSVTLKQEDGLIVTAFANDAPQLGQEDAEHLFERFYTADRMRSGQNTGLGLAIVKELAEKMNARANAELTDGRLNIEVVWETYVNI